jgi:hypothetical protein
LCTTTNGNALVAGAASAAFAGAAATAAAAALAVDGLALQALINKVPAASTSNENIGFERIFMVLIPWSVRRNDLWSLRQ